MSHEDNDLRSAFRAVDEGVDLGHRELRALAQWLISPETFNTTTRVVAVARGCLFLIAREERHREVLEYYATGNGETPNGHCGDYGERAREVLGIRQPDKKP